MNGIIHLRGVQNETKLQQGIQGKSVRIGQKRRNKARSSGRKAGNKPNNAIPMGGRIRNPRRRSVRRKRTSAKRGRRVKEAAQRKRTLKNGERNTKKSSDILREAPCRRIKFAKEELGIAKISEVCKLLGVSRSEYYRVPKMKESEEIALEKAVINCFNKHKGNYGRIRIRRELLLKGIKISEYRISNILKRNGLTAKTGRKCKTKKPKPTEKQYIEENLIKDKFRITEPNYLWCSDIKELKCLRWKVYICVIIDVATRRIVGWSISRTIVQDAFTMAIEAPERCCIPQRQRLSVYCKENKATDRKQRF